MDNADRFVEAFVRIEKSLREIASVNRFMKFHQLVDICSKKNTVVKINFSKLLDYADLRNVLVHQRDDNNDVLAQPTDNAVEAIEKVATQLEDDKKAIEFASKPVRVVRLSDTLDYAYQAMYRLKTTKIPVYDDNCFVNLLTMESIGNWLINNESKIATVADVVEGKDNVNKVIFFDINRRLGDVIDAFENGLVSGTNLSAIIISENGKCSDYPKGIITVYDLPKIMSYIL